MVEDLRVIGGVILFVLAIYILTRLLNRKPFNKNYQKELEEILTKEDYKVKGKFE